MVRGTNGNALLWFLLLLGGLFVFSMLVVLPFGDVTLPTPKLTIPDDPVDAELAHNTFASCSSLAETLAAARDAGAAYYRGDVALDSAAPQAVSESAGVGGGGGANIDYTGTNVQVEGIDEADVVKTDGNYVYVLVPGGSIHIVDVRDPEGAALLSTIEPGGSWARDMFVDGDVLAVFTNSFAEAEKPEIEPIPQPLPESAPSSRGISAEADALLYPYPGGIQLVSVELYDIRDRENPALIRTVQFEGNLLTSRLIDGEIVVVVQSWPNLVALQEDRPETLVPGFRDGSGGDFEPAVGCGDVQQITPVVESSFLTVGRFSASAADSTVERSVTLGAGSVVYASHDTLYVAGYDHAYGGPVPLGIVDSVLGVPEAEEPRERTRIHAFSLGEQIAYLGSTRVFGSVLNQFSMDRHEDAFRIATTEHRWGRRPDRNGPVNALYTLDAETLEPLGSIEGIAPGETIYSARFLGERAYLVTFKKVDPFFAIDLADPRNPKILGQLKIPGYSDYLHPFNAEGTVIIGVGKDAVAAEQGDFAWYQGMKLALFDATDPTNPTQLHTVSIGDRGTDSPALHNHKAFLFDPTRNLLVLPITLAEIPDEIKEQSRRPEGSEYGSFTYQGAFVYRLTEEQGFEELGRITHLDDPESYFIRTGFWAGNSSFFVNRAFRIEDALVTFSNGRLLLSDLSNELSELSRANFPGAEDADNPVNFEEDILR